VAASSSGGGSKVGGESGASCQGGRLSPGGADAVWGGGWRGGVRAVLVENTSEKTCLGRNSHGIEVPMMVGTNESIRARSAN
jgi:hypothetical protein